MELTSTGGFCGDAQTGTELRETLTYTVSRTLNFFQKPAYSHEISIFSTRL